MNTHQIIRQLKYEIEAHLFDSGANKAFSAAIATVGIAESAASRINATPFVLIRPGVENPDGDLQGLCEVDIELELVVSRVGDQLGEFALTGGAISDITKPNGAGLLRIGRELETVIRRMQTNFGIKISGMRAGASVPFIVGAEYVLSRPYSVRMNATEDPHYHAPTCFNAADAGSGNATLTWVDPPTRFDSRSLIIRRAAGATAPTSATAGTAVATVALGTQTYSDNPGSGQFSYAIFEAYTDSGQATNESYSSQEVGTTSTVTVT